MVTKNITIKKPFYRNKGETRRKEFEEFVLTGDAPFVKTMEKKGR